MTAMGLLAELAEKMASRAKPSTGFNPLVNDGNSAQTSTWAMYLRGAAGCVDARLAFGRPGMQEFHSPPLLGSASIHTSFLDSAYEEA